MPFTLSHPAAVLPIHRLLGRRLSLSALVIGSMMPDLPYFVPLELENAVGHSLLGIALFWLPLGIAIYLFFHLFIRRALIDLLPYEFLCRMKDATSRRVEFPRQPMWLVSISIIIGAATHIAWDGFTHANTFVTSNSNFLNFVLIHWEGHAFPVFRILQYMSSIAGLAFVFLAVKRWAHCVAVEPIQTSVQPLTHSYRAMFIAMIAVPTFIATVYGFFEPSEWIELALLRAAVWFVVALGISILFYAFFWNVCFLVSGSGSNRVQQNIP